MRHLLFYLVLNLMFFSGNSLYAQAAKPCIKANGQNPTPSGTPGDPPYVYKCANSSIPLQLYNCGSAFLDPSQYDQITWYAPPTRFPINGAINVSASTTGIWTVVISYTDPIYGTTTTDSAKVNVIDYAGPSPSEMIVIQDESYQPINAGNTKSYCSGETLTFHATTNNKYVPGSYKWFVNTTPNDTSTAVVGTGLDLSYTFTNLNVVTVMATDLNGCKIRTSVTILKKNAPTTPNLGADKYKCSGTSVTLSAYQSPVSNQSSFTYSWNGNTGVPGEDTKTVTAPGKYWVTVQNFPSQPCLATDTVYVYDTPPPSFTLSNDTSVCYQAQGPLHARSSSTLSYTWSPASYFTSGNTGADPTINFNGIATGSYVISVTATDVNSCTTTKTMNVTHLAQGSNPYMLLSADPLNICEGSTKAFNTIASTTYPTTLTFAWTPATYLSSDTARKPMVNLSGSPLNTPVNYTLQVTDSKGCYLTVNTSATLVPAVDVTLDFNDTSICLGNSIALQANATGGTGALAYAWSPATDLSNAAIADPVSTPTANRNYTVTVTDTKGCSDYAEVTVKPVIVTVNLVSTDTSGYNIEPMVLTPQVGGTTYKYQWTNKTTLTALGTNKSQTVTETATYVVLATDSLSGCQASDSINVTIQVGNPRLIYVPNVFNPASSNPDNKVVKVYGTAVQETDFAFRIYNKWGEMIYETTSFTDANTQGWTGGYKSNEGTEQHLAVYTYSLHGRYFDGQEFDKTGSITLVR